MPTNTPLKIAAFSEGNSGGNPAGVLITDRLPDPKQMLSIANDVGFSETAFAAPDGTDWTVRYYAPESEVAFCGHATIALGAALGERYGAGTYTLNISKATIPVRTYPTDFGWAAELQSPQTWSMPLDADLTTALLTLFGITAQDLDPRLPPTMGFAGNKHPLITLKDRSKLASMSYDFDAGLKLMQDHNLTTINLLFIKNETTFISRNAFAIGGVVEDPATGAAAAALGGALVDQNWTGFTQGSSITIHQGQDMGMPSTLKIRTNGNLGDGIFVSGTARNL